MPKGTIDRRKGVTAVVVVVAGAVFSLLLLPLLTVSPTGFDLNKFAAMAQEEASSSPSSSSSSSNQTEIVVVAQTPEEQANLDRFDKLDFEAWNNRNWTLFQELHSPDVLVSAQPESKVLAHPIKIAAGNWTAVTGTLPGNLTMVTLARWEDGRIAEEYLFLQSPPAPMIMNQTEASQ
jgi:hypothetical protein